MVPGYCKLVSFFTKPLNYVYKNFTVGKAFKLMLVCHIHVIFTVSSFVGNPVPAAG